MQHGPYGITSALSLFLAVYKAILALHVQIGLLGNTKQSTVADSLMPLLEGVFIRLLKIALISFFLEIRAFKTPFKHTRKLGSSSNLATVAW
jgi:hypothetical protein